MLWFVAVIFAVIFTIIGLKRWKIANNPLYAVSHNGKKTWLKNNTTKLTSDDIEIEGINGVFDSSDTAADPSFSDVPGNAFYHEDD